MTDRCGRQARVIGPLPTITERANNKLWFTDVVAAVLGSDSVLDARAARSPGEVCAELVEIATRLADSATSAARVTLKLTDSASGMGTSIFEPAAILERSPESLRAFVDDWLHEHEPDSRGRFRPAFLPRQRDRFPRRHADPPPNPISDRIGEAGVRIGRVFQRLGYVGRCSFDTILVGDDLTDAAIKFTECNGRWGGTSTPMSLMNRLFGDYREQPYSCRNFAAGNLKGVPFDELKAALEGVLYDAPSGEGWAILFNLGCLEPAGKFDLITLGGTLEEAEQRQEGFDELVARLFPS